VTSIEYVDMSKLQSILLRLEGWKGDGCERYLATCAPTIFKTMETGSHCQFLHQYRMRRVVFF
jgi:hypothetical protein